MRWEVIKKYGGNYAVSDTGLVKNIKTDRLIKCFLNQNGYPLARLYHNGKNYGRPVHRLVAEAFLICTPNQHVNHIDKNKLNNNLSNLEATTQRENTTHYFERDFTGAYYRGKGRWQARITIDKKYLCLGTYGSPEEAHQAYLAALNCAGINNKYARANSPVSAKEG